MLSICGMPPGQLRSDTAIYSIEQGMPLVEQSRKWIILNEKLHDCELSPHRDSVDVIGDSLVIETCN